MRSALTAALATALLSLTGCAHDTKRADPPPTSPIAATSTTPTTPTTPTTTARTTTAPAGPKAPFMPAAARRQTTAGGKAFVKYYIGVLNYAGASLSTDLLDRLSTGDCEVCHVLRDFTDRMRRRGGMQVSGAWTGLRIQVLPRNDPSERNFVVHIHVHRGTEQRESTSTPQRIKAQTVYDVFALKWHAGSWRLADLYPTG